MIGYRWVSPLKIGKIREVHFNGRYYVMYRQPNYGANVLTVYPF